MRKRNRFDAEERHRRAVAQTTEWAKDAAEAGQFQDALSWIRVLEAVDGTLSAELEALSAQCLAVVRARAQAHDARRRQFADVA